MARLGKVVAAATVAAGLVAAPATMSSAATRALAAKVRVVDNDFRPETVTVPVGSTVGWINRGFTQHTVTFAGQDVAVLDPGEKARRRFTQAGTYEYMCRFHFGMNGEVVVTD